jgi:hypothetical protein
MESNLKVYLTVWLSGLLAGLILMERWRRVGAREIAAASEAELVAAPSVPAESPVPGDASKMTQVLFAGAKADALRVRHLVLRATPWTPSSLPAQLAGSQLAPPPAGTTLPA